MERALRLFFAAIAAWMLSRGIDWSYNIFTRTINQMPGEVSFIIGAVIVTAIGYFVQRPSHISDSEVLIIHRPENEEVITGNITQRWEQGVHGTNRVRQHNTNGILQH